MCFYISKIEYLSLISAKGLETNPKKVEAVSQWPEPKSVKELRSFLRLSRYYKKFIRGYDIISRTLTNLLMKGVFEWSNLATEAFNALKQTLTTALVLAIPNFSIPFEIETDASKGGIRAVFMQVHHPIAYISRFLSPRWLPVYQKWEQYLLGAHFIIRTD